MSWCPWLSSASDPHLWLSSANQKHPSINWSLYTDFLVVKKWWVWRKNPRVKLSPENKSKLPVIMIRRNLKQYISTLNEETWGTCQGGKFNHISHAYIEHQEHITCLSVGIFQKLHQCNRLIGDWCLEKALQCWWDWWEFSRRSTAQFLLWSHPKFSYCCSHHFCNRAKSVNTWHTVTSNL